jgi:hypothetical protein
MEAEGLARQSAHRPEVRRMGTDRQGGGERLRDERKSSGGEDGNGAHRGDSCGESARLSRLSGLG